MGIVLVLKDSVRSFWISKLDSWRIFGVFLFRKDFVIFFSFRIIFLDFQSRIFFFFSLILAYIFNPYFLLVFFFPLPGLETRGIMGPGFI